MSTDNFGRTVTFSTDGVTDSYAVSGSGSSFTVSYPAGTSTAEVYASINAQSPVEPPVSTDQKLQAAQAFGCSLIRQMIATNTARGLSPSQRATFQAAVLPVAISLMVGDLNSAISEIASVTVDGTLITQPLVDAFTAQIKSYLGI